MIIGIAGNKQSGKDTVAEALVEVGYTKCSFAGKLKEICSELFDIPMGHFECGTLKETVDGRYGMTPREILIAVGTDCFREIDSKVWINYVLDNGSRNMIISDTRFQNEVDTIIKNGGIIFRVVREGYTKGADVGDIDWKLTPHVLIENNWTKLSLKLDAQKAERLSRSIISELGER